MKVAETFKVLVRAFVLGLIVATFALAPLGVIPANADGGSTGLPGQPTDSTLNAPAFEDPEEAYEPLITASLYISILRFIDF